MAYTEPVYDPAAMSAVIQFNYLVDHLLSIERSEDDLVTIKLLQQVFSDYLKSASLERARLEGRLTGLGPTSKELENV